MRSFIARIISYFILIYAKTWRIKYHTTGDYEKVLESGGIIIHSLWHNQLLPLSYNWRKVKAATLASQSKDGQIISDILTHWGFTMARGSSSKGGLRGLLRLKKLLETGSRIAALTVDGPRGPRYVVKPGAVLLAKMTGAAVIPVFFSTKSFKQFKSWDKFILPLPFARVDTYMTDAVYFDNDMSEEAVQRDSKLLTRIMNERRDEICPHFL